MNKSYNRVTLCGTVATTPQFSHSNHGQSFFLLYLTVDRLSTQQDKLRIIVSDALLKQYYPLLGDTVTVSGQLRSFNNKSGIGSRLILSVFAHQLCPDGELPVNRIFLFGTICKPTTFRRTPMGREICDVILAVNRRYGRADYLPCIAWGAVAQRVGQMEIGQQLAVEGRLQSRTYRKLIDGEMQERTAYEVSIMRPCDAAEFCHSGIDFASRHAIMDTFQSKEGAFDDAM